MPLVATGVNAATDTDLAEAYRMQSFREDLYSRLGGIRQRVDPAGRGTGGVG